MVRHWEQILLLLLCKYANQFNLWHQLLQISLFHPVPPGLWYCWWCCGLYSGPGPLLYGAVCSGGRPGALWGVLLRVCIWWLLGVLGLIALEDESPAGASSSSIPSRVKSHNSGSSATEDESVWKTNARHIVRVWCEAPHLLNMDLCCWASAAELRRRRSTQALGRYLWGRRHRQQNGSNLTNNNTLNTAWSRSPDRLETD